MIEILIKMLCAVYFVTMLLACIFGIADCIKLFIRNTKKFNALMKGESDHVDS